MYEPIISGWFIELASFILVIAIGIVICQKVAAQYNEAAVLNERAINMEQLYETQKTYFTLLKEEMEEIRKIRHDIHHHYTMIDGFIKNQQYDNLSNYISTCQPCFTNEQIKEYCNLDVINILSYHFDYIAQKNKIDLKIRCDVTIDKEKNINISDTDLCSLYSNLMENAMEACLRIKNNKRFIKVAIVCISTNSLMIRIWNSVDNESIIKKGDFYSSKRKNHKGYGLLSIKNIVKKYNGQTSFIWHKENCTFESKIIFNSSN